MNKLKMARKWESKWINEMWIQNMKHMVHVTGPSISSRLILSLHIYGPLKSYFSHDSHTQYDISQLMRYGTYHKGDQRRLRRACAYAQSRHSLRCSHIWSMEVDEGSNQKSDIYPTGWLPMRFWKMSLRRTKSTIISWDGSYAMDPLMHGTLEQ